MEKKIIAAIDGPAGSGKSSSAKKVAALLGFTYIDTGAMYRAVTYTALRNGMISNIDAISEFMRNISIRFEGDGGIQRVILNGEDITEAIRSPEVNAHVSPISEIESVRKKLVSIQQEMGREGNVVMEGRDIGTRVFPDAQVKIFLSADISERGKRRMKELLEKGTALTPAEVEENLRLRDSIDSSRDIDPLRKADDAIEIDTTSLTFDEQVNKIIEIIENVRQS